ncbi:hypothetical protein FJT64_027852 [Amphibalanus amphitrite]|uniref:Tudor-knot domain-containing protein n=1 Tax=Amphibalanus amphitrite TaxID=1232801 RepID=A0A6A4W6P2_AMPAM|nr:hypothetical protein FJT64_027852 [Amphibalanus amphitrite]
MCSPSCPRSPETLPPYVDVQVGDKVSVLYKINSKKERTIYEAKVLQVDPVSPVRRYFIHYLNWNKRYDEWVKRNRIIENLSWAPTRARRNSRVETKPAATAAASAAGSVPSPSGGRRGRSPVVQSAPAASSTRGSTPASDVARSPGSSGRAAVRQSAERDRKTTRKGTPAPSDSEPEPAESAEDGAAARRRLARQRSTTSASRTGADAADDDGKTTPTRRGSRRVRKRDSETPVKSAASPSATRGEEDSNASAERTEQAGSDEGAAPKPRQAEADSTSDASAPAPASAAAAAAPADTRSSVSDIYEFTDECEDGFPARDASNKLKNVINTYGARPGRSPGAADNPPSTAAAAPPAPASSPAATAGTAPLPAAAGVSPGSPSLSPSPSKKRKLAGDDARSPLSTPSKAARRTPTRRAPGQTPSPRRPAKKRAASASPSPSSRAEPPLSTTGTVITPKLTVTKLTDFQLSRVTLVKASSVKPVTLPPPPRLQPAPQVLGAAEYKPAPLPGPAGRASSEPAQPLLPRAEPVRTPPPAAAKGLQPTPMAVVRPPVPAPAAAAVPQKPPVPRPTPVSVPGSSSAPVPAPAPSSAAAKTSVSAPAPVPAPAPTPVPASVSAPTKAPSAAAPPPSVSVAPPPAARAATPPPAPAAAASDSSSPGGREPTARWRHEPDSERRVAALSSPAKSSAGSGCDLTCRETIPGSPERVEGPGRPASAASDRMEMPFASLPSGVRPAAETERARRDGHEEPVRPKVESERLRREEPRPKVETDRPRPKPEAERVRPKPEPERPRAKAEESGRPRPELERTPAARREEAERVRREGAEEGRRERAVASAPDSPEGSEFSSKRGSAQVTPGGGRSPVSSEGEASPGTGAGAADAARPPASRSAAGTPSSEVNGLVASLAPASLPAGRGLRQQPPAPAAAEDDEPTSKRRRTRRRRRRISARSGKGVSDSDDLNDRSNGDRGDADPEARRAEKAYKYNFMVTFDDAADRQTRIQVLTEQIDKLRDRYSTVKAELGRVHRRIKKLKKKQRDTPAPPPESSVKKLRPSFVTP